MPAFVKPFIEKGTTPIIFESADLNKDAVIDHILVLEKLRPNGEPLEMERGQRPLLILLGGPNGKLTLAERSENVIWCSRCGGNDEGSGDGRGRLIRDFHD